MATADLLLHPVRLRLVKAFLGDRTLTARQLAAELPDVPPATIYRHLGRLSDAGVLRVVAERRVRGTVERTYGLDLPAAQVSPDEVAALTPDEHGRAFVAYVAGLLGDFDRYLTAGPADLAADHAGYRVAALWLTDEELAAFQRELRDLAAARLANGPGPGRRRRMLYTVQFPGPEFPGPEIAEPEIPGSGVPGTAGPG
jgi:DNA-binding transcriptional ArsR family regulator